MGTRLRLDGRSISSEADIHDAIDEVVREAGLEGYGRNLDALWDTLTGILEPPVHISWVNLSSARKSLGNRLDRILGVFADAHRERGADFTFETQE